MSKTKSISVLVKELQRENEKAQSLIKLFNQACKNEFGYDVKTIHQMLEKQRIYEQRMASKQGQQQNISRSEM